MSTDDEITFLRTYKDFIYYFNMLDRNIGFCLRRCMTLRGTRNAERWLSVSFDSKVKQLLRLAKECGVADAFASWSSDLEKCRHLRNIVAHGNWEWHEFIDKPIQYHAPEIDDGEGSFTNDEFTARLIFLIGVSETFQKARTLVEAACDKMAHHQAAGERC